MVCLGGLGVGLVLFVDLSGVVRTGAKGHGNNLFRVIWKGSSGNPDMNVDRQPRVLNTNNPPYHRCLSSQRCTSASL